MINFLLTKLRDIFMPKPTPDDYSTVQKDETMNARKMREMHHTLIDHRDWPFKYFTPEEIACKGTGLILIDFDAISKLDELRDIIKEPFRPNSAYRSAVHNKNIGGSRNSMHLQGKAFDIPIKGKMTREKLHIVADHVGFTGIGDYDTFVHVDTGRKRYWDERTGD